MHGVNEWWEFFSEHIPLRNGGLTTISKILSKNLAKQLNLF